MAIKEDYYETLGISKTASEPEIKKAFRNLAKKYHPDVSQHKDAEAKFRKINEAYEVLGDSTKRTAYDQYGHAGVDGQFGNQGGFGGFEGFSSSSFNFGGQGGGFGGFEDIFGSIFGRSGGSSNRYQQQQHNQRNADVYREVAITMKDVIFGKTIKINFDKRRKCVNCNGTKANSPSDVQNCNACGGSGHQVRTQRTILGNLRQNVICGSCKGQGKTITKKCQKCSGSGYNIEKEEISVKIPTGIDNGQQIRLSDKGHSDEIPGDVYIQIAVENHPYFKRDDDDLFLRIPVSYENAVLGTKVNIPTFRGDVTMKIPAGTQPNQFFRIKNQGIPRLHSKSIGDLYVEIQIKIPKNLKTKEKENLKFIQDENLQKIFLEYARKIAKTV